MITQMNNMKKSVKSINPCKSVIQTSYDIVKTPGGGLKVETKENEGAAFIIELPFTWRNLNTISVFLIIQLIP